jgi:hypothetical protein
MFGPPQPNAMLQAVDHAVHVYRGDRAAWQIIQRNGMEQVRPHRSRFHGRFNIGVLRRTQHVASRPQRISL